MTTIFNGIVIVAAVGFALFWLAVYRNDLRSNRVQRRLVRLFALALVVMTTTLTLELVTTSAWVAVVLNVVRISAALGLFSPPLLGRQSR